jgi:hypothetical protein
MFYQEFDSPEELQAYCDRVLATQGRKAYEQQCGCDTSHLERKSSMPSTFDQHYQQQSLQHNTRHESPELKAIHERQEELRNTMLASKRRLEAMGADLALNRMAYLRENPEIASMRRASEKLQASIDRLIKKATPFVTGLMLDRMEANAAAQQLRDREALRYRYGSVVGSE